MRLTKKEEKIVLALRKYYVLNERYEGIFKEYPRPFGADSKHRMTAMELADNAREDIEALLWDY